MDGGGALGDDHGCAVLITSRNDLSGLGTGEGTVHVPLGVLEPAQARTVLATMIGERRVQAEPDAVAELSQACGYLPLALRIAGADLAADTYRTIASYDRELAEVGQHRGRLAPEVHGTRPGHR